MKLFLLFILFGDIQANSNELLKAVCKQCQTGLPIALRILISYSVFTVKLTSVFLHTLDENAENRKFLKELEARYIWSYLCSKNASLPNQLTEVRETINELGQRLKFSGKCLTWMDFLLGDGEDMFEGSYLEMLINILSATERANLGEMSTKQLLFVHSEFRKMHYEREYLFIPKNEAMHDIYTQYVRVYHSLINDKLGATVWNSVRHATFKILKVINQSTQAEKALESTFLRKYISRDDFIAFNGRLHLRKSTNFIKVYENWHSLMSNNPDKHVRSIYFDEGKDVLQNMKSIEVFINSLHLQMANPANMLKWKQTSITSIVLAFDLVESLLSYERRKISVAKQKRMLCEILHQFTRLQRLDVIG